MLQIGEEEMKNSADHSQNNRFEEHLSDFLVI